MLIFLSPGFIVLNSVMCPSEGGQACPSVRRCVPVWKGVPQCGRVYSNVGGCALVWEGVPQCGRVCPSLEGYAPMWEGVPQCA